MLAAATVRVWVVATTNLQVPGLPLNDVCGDLRMFPHSGVFVFFEAFNLRRNHG